MSHYSGHIKNSDVPLMPLKCGVNERMPLLKRIQPIQDNTEAVRARQAKKTASTPEPIRSYFLQKRHHGETTYMTGSKTYIRSGEDVPARQKEPKNAVPEGLEAPKFQAETTTHANSSLISAGHQGDFYSKARKIERGDDDVRRDVYIPPTRAGASHMQRTVDIMRNREHSEALQPPKESYSPVKRSSPAIPQLSKSEHVRFTHISPMTTNQTDFQAPHDKLAPIAGTLTSSSTPTAGTTEQRRAISQMSSSKELFAGTAKDRGDLVPGFMGHVPSHGSNNGRINGPNDPLRLYSKCPHNVAVAKSTSAAAAAADNVSIHHHSIPRGDLTMGAFFETQAVSSPEERGMNKVTNGRSTAVRKFFSAGAADPDNTVADQFCTKFRPGGGTMKQGPSSSWAWIQDQELRRITMRVNDDQ